MMEIVADAMVPALLSLLTPIYFAYLCLGVGIGLAVGILPGLGGLAGLSLVLPFTFGMEPGVALAMMIGLIAPTTTSDTFASVLMGIPGTSASQATVLDGFPLAKQGQAARALSAAFIASLIGGVLGALVLTAAVFVARPIILAIGFGEQLMLVIFSLSMVGMLTGASALKGLGSCGVGLLLGSIGAAPATGEYRMTFETVYLSDGLSIVIVGLGMFAVPEIIDLLRRHKTISGTGTLGKGWLAGALETLRHRWLVMRCALIGCLIGALPGLGGSVIDWIAYGHVVQTSKDRSQFGNGDIRGVIAPESANNAKEGGALIPTLLFGIPGSGTMALLLGGFILIGIEPGIGMVTRDLDLTFTMIWSLALANVVGAGACFLIAPQVAKLTTIRYALIGPVMIVVIFFAAFQITRSLHDFTALFIIGAAGVYMKRFGWPRPALLIGFVLAGGLETSVYQAVQVYGMSFFERPLVLIILLLTVMSVAAAVIARPPQDSAQREAKAAIRRRVPQVVFTVLLAIFTIVAAHDAILRSYLGQIFPLVVALGTLGILLAVSALQIFSARPRVVFADAEEVEEAEGGIVHYLSWIAGLLAATLAVGFPIAAALFVFIFATVKAGGSVLRNTVLALSTIIVLGILAHYLTLVYPGGLLQVLVRMPDWLGHPV